METSTLYGGRVKLRLDGRHAYWAAVDGKSEVKVIGTTSISGILDKGGLPFWAAGLAFDYALAKASTGSVSVEDRENAINAHNIEKNNQAKSGKEVHAWCEAYAMSVMNGTDAPDVSRDERVMNGCLAFMRWVSDHKVKFRVTERLVYSIAYGYGGSMDVECMIDDDGLWRVTDYKTSKARKPKKATDVCHLCLKVGCGGVYDEVRFQTALYRAAAEEEGTVYGGERLVVRLDKDTGEYSMHILDGYEKDLVAARHMLEVKRRMIELA